MNRHCTLNDVPIEFTRLDYISIPEANLISIWEIIGPSIDRNLKNLPLWKVMAITYLEGLEHGSSTVYDKINLEREDA